MRLFLAIDIPDGLRERLCDLPRTNGMKAVASELLHVTLKFLGDVDDDGLQFLKEALGRLVCPPLRLRTTVYGSFGRPPRVLWLGVEDADVRSGVPDGGGGVAGQRSGIRVLFREIERLLGPRFPRDEKPFHPHITLARIKGQTPEAKRLVAVMVGVVRVFVWDAHEIVLYESTLMPEGPLYRRVAVFGSALPHKCVGTMVGQ